jgi:hypothetical protein
MTIYKYTHIFLTLFKHKFIMTNFLENVFVSIQCDILIENAY